MNLIISPGPSLHGEIAPPGDKSLSHRAAMFAALAEGESRIDNFLVSGVTRSMLHPLAELGVDWELDGSRLRLAGRSLTGLQAAPQPLDCGNSATTLRMLTGALVAAGLPAILDGSAGLRRRPMERLVAPLQAMGARLETTPGGCAPLRLAGRPAGQPLRGLTHHLAVASAQVKTAILLAGLAADGPTMVIEPGPSRDHTERMLASMGAEIQIQPGDPTPDHQPTITVQPLRASLQPLNLELPGDFSAAAFLIVAALVTPGSEIVLRGVGLNPTRTGLLDALLAMGADIRVSAAGLRHGEPVGDLTVRASPLVGTLVEGPLVVRMIDEFPIFAVAAACATGRTQVRQAEELRYKESDRIAALHKGLGGLGVDVQEAPDGFTIAGGTPFSGGRLPTFGDHRLAMSLAVAGLAGRQPVSLAGAEIIAESFPGFVNALQSLGANLQED